VGRPDRPQTERNRSRCHGSDAERLQRCSDADDVGDRVPGANLVEAHVLDPNAMGLGFGLGQPGEDSDRPGADGVFEVCVLEKGANLGPLPVRQVLGDSVDVDLGCTHPGAVHCAGAQTGLPQFVGIFGVCGGYLAWSGA
jgi:hypothetical protein